MRTAVSTLLALVALAVAPVAAADYYIVVSEQSPVTSLTRREALHLFMGRTRHFPDGSPALACDLASDAQRDGFYRLLGGMSLAQVTSYWARLMFSGRSLPPQKLGNEAEMVRRIRADPMAIGWLPRAPEDKGLRVLLVLEEPK